MTARLNGRRRAARAVIDDVGHWAVGESHVLAVALVGSYARSAERMGSDVDILILSDEPDRLADAGWFQTLRPRARLIRLMEWGPVRERRLRLRSGLQVELNFAPPSWAAVPLDSGTRRVLRDGHRILYDTGVLGPAAAALIGERHGS
jgi:predicted nucleotidyltransferase